VDSCKFFGFVVHESSFLLSFVSAKASASDR
jgi:hypothetical protein